MFPYTNPVRKIFSNGAKIKKYLKNFKESQKDPFSFMGIIPHINFQRLWRFYLKNTGSRIAMTVLAVFFVFSSVAFLLGIVSENKKDLVCPLEGLSFLVASPKIFLEMPSQNHLLISANKFSAESPGFLLIEKNSLRAATPPVMVSTQVLGTMVAGYESENEKKSISEHVVEDGDTLSSLAERFNISTDTIRWTNDLKDSRIRIGQKLVIPPVSGIIHYVKSGDTISGIASAYKGKTSEIVAFNELASENDIYIGDIIVVPDGVMPAPSAKPTVTQSSTPISSAYFIAPTKGQISQGLHWHNAIDFSNSCGALVFAAAQGMVQRISYGWNSGYGNQITILHPNGVVTLYAHLSEISVSSGANVSQGTIIGRVGNTGRTVGATGCHVHFEVRGGQNPFAGYRIGTRF